MGIRVSLLFPVTVVRNAVYLFFESSSDNKVCIQRAKKVLSDSPGLLDFVIGLVNCVRDLPDGQVEYFEEFNLQKNCEIQLIKKFLGLVEMTFGQVNASFSLPEWQAVKMTFFAPWAITAEN